MLEDGVDGSEVLGNGNEVMVMDILTHYKRVLVEKPGHLALVVSEPLLA